MTILFMEMTLIMNRKFLILLATLLLVLPSFAQDDVQPMSLELQLQLDELRDLVQEGRGLDELRPVNIRLPTRDEVEVYFAEVIEAEFSPELLTETTAFYRAFNFLPDDFDLVGELSDLYSAQVAGFYDTETQTLNVILMSGQVPDSGLPFLERVVFVHEYIHDLQDQHFQLDSLFETATSSDHELAILALIEGDATFIMNNYVRAESQLNPLGTIASLITGGLQAGNLTLPPDLPDILGAELLFAYDVGEPFVRELVIDGGIENVNNAFSNPPMSTEQVIHPEKYLAQEMPIEVTLPDLTEMNLTSLTSGVLGEFYLRQYLATQDLSRADINLASTGWGGDAYAIYAADSGEELLVWRTVWDSETDRDEFITVYIQWAELNSGVMGDTDDENVTCYQAEDTLCIIIDDEVTVLHGATTVVELVLDTIR